MTIATRIDWLNEQDSAKLREILGYAENMKNLRDSAPKRYYPVYADMPGKWEAEIATLRAILDTRQAEADALHGEALVKSATTRTAGIFRNDLGPAHLRAHAILAAAELSDLAGVYHTDITHSVEDVAALEILDDLGAVAHYDGTMFELTSAGELWRRLVLLNV